jgi:L-arabinose isomerase
MSTMRHYEFWLITGSQHLYGQETLDQVNADSQKIAAHLDTDEQIPGRVVFKPVVTTPQEILKICEEANTAPNCAGVITWMHTFSPSKMWIAGLLALRKPHLHFNTQYNREIPWDSIDMDFMNLNQSAHGDREHGFINTRLRLNRKVITGYWQDEETKRRIGAWARSAIGVLESKRLKIARFGDNMREVAVTEGDKVEAQIRLGWSVNGYGLGDLLEYVNAATAADIDTKMQEYAAAYDLATGNIDAVKYQARIEVGLGNFLTAGGFGGFTTTFENLSALEQLPGLAVQNLMAKGIGFGAEGDWKMAGLLRIMKLMSEGLQGGTSFMEDYTYHLEKGRELVLGAHMLEVCPSIAADRPKIEVHALGIGGKADPARLVFDGRQGNAILVTFIDMGNRFRMIVNDVEAVKPLQNMPLLPVASVMWKPLPDLAKASEAWILSGGAHHSIMSYGLTIEHMRSFAESLDMELVHINAKTDADELADRLRLNDVVWKLR